MVGGVLTDWVAFPFVGGILIVFKFSLVGIGILIAWTEISFVDNVLESVADFCVFSEGEVVVWIWAEPGVVFVLASSFGACVEKLNILGASGLVVGTPVAVEIVVAVSRVIVLVWVFDFLCLSEVLGLCCRFSESVGGPDAAFCLLSSNLLLCTLFGFPGCLKSNVLEFGIEGSLTSMFNFAPNGILCLPFVVRDPADSKLLCGLSCSLAGCGLVWILSIFDLPENGFFAPALNSEPVETL